MSLCFDVNNKKIKTIHNTSLKDSNVSPNKKHFSPNKKLTLYS